ncbi:MAG: hypothetical protein FWC75_04545 [Oscillospiraceae bacterium]|nr:hypothetical protein [Oscillospiraceae bacterium]
MTLSEKRFDLPISARIKDLKAKRERINKDMRLNFERNRIITEYYRNNENEYPVLKRGGFLHAWCTSREINIDDDDIFVGDAGPRTRSVHFDIEVTPHSWFKACFGDTDERFRAAWQVPGSVWVTDEERAFILDAADWWVGNDIASTGRGLMPPDWFEQFPEGMDFSMFSGSYPGHFCPNYERAVTVGFGTVRKTALEKIDAIKADTTYGDVRSELFYRGIVRVCDGMIAMSKRYAQGCRDKAASASSERRAELLKMADALDWIIENPARNLWEGLQVILFYQNLLTADGTHWADSPGLIDSYLGPLAENDIKTGALTQEGVQELFDAFLIQMGNQIIMFPKPTNDTLIEAHNNNRTFFDLQGGMQNLAAGMQITVGGMTADGTSGVYNIATEAMLLSYYRLRVAEPSIALRINQYTPDHIWALGVACSKRLGGMPQFNNDDVIIPAMHNRGIPIEDARQYGVFGCVEPAISGKEWSLPANCGIFGGGFSMTGLLNFVIHGNIDPLTQAQGTRPCKKLYEYESFDEIKEEFEGQIKNAVNRMVRFNQYAAFIFDTAWPILSASVMTEGCVESGKDVTWGGAKYNGHGFFINAIGTVADSLSVIKKLCFDEQKITTRELYDALANNWEGAEMLRQKILNEGEFYGNDLDTPDQIVEWFTNYYADYYMSKEGPYGGTLNPGSLDLFWVAAGKRVWATPDGRRAKEPLSHSSDPTQSAVKNGPLAYVKSVAKMPWYKMRFGGAINLRLDANSVNSDDAEAKMRELIETYFDLGGIQFHFTVADTSVMRAAQKSPKDYQDLVVRIAGFSAYFTHLPRDVQDNYIERYEMGV